METSSVCVFWSRVNWMHAEIVQDRAQDLSTVGYAIYF